MRRIIALLTALSLLAGMAAAASLGAEAEGLPTSVTLSWNPVEGAAHYDIYNGDKPVARLGSDASSYTVEKLLSDEEYTFCVAARGEGNEDIDAEWVSVSTSSWDGVYEWINETDKDKFEELDQKLVKYEEITDRVEFEIASYLNEVSKSEISEESGAAGRPGLHP